MLEGSINSLAKKCPGIGGILQHVAVDLAHKPIWSVAIELGTPDVRLGNNAFISEGSHVQPFGVVDDVQARLADIVFYFLKFV